MTIGLNTKYYTDYSIGFLTRGCFRHCTFCVNQHYNKVVAHSPLEEFLDTSKRKICLLDDNFFGYSNWKNFLVQLQNSGKKFQFKQGLDVRLLDDEKAYLLFNSKYDGDFIFAFDNIADAPLIEKKLQLIRDYTNKNVKFYIFCGYDRSGKYEDNFWKQDIFDVFRRVELLMKYDCKAYTMRYKAIESSPYIAAWTNQAQFYTKTSFREFAMLEGEGKSRHRYMNDFLIQFPEFAYHFNMKYENLRR